MFEQIIEYFNESKKFVDKGIYLENKKNIWLTIIPRDNGKVFITFKNGGFKKQKFCIENKEDSREIFLLWKEEINSLGVENKIFNLFEENKEDFINKVIISQRKFRKNIRTFEQKLQEKFNFSNEKFQSEDEIKYNILFRLIKQFKIKADSPSLSIFNNTTSKEAVVIEDKDKKERISIYTPLELKSYVEEKLNKEEKRKFKESFKNSALKLLESKINTEITGIKRIFETYNI